MMQTVVLGTSCSTLCVAGNDDFSGLETNGDSMKTAFRSRHSLDTARLSGRKSVCVTKVSVDYRFVLKAVGLCVTHLCTSDEIREKCALNK